MALLKNPLVLLKSEKTPVAVLKPPLISLVKARRPVAVFWLPAVRWLSASKPVPVFQTPPVRLTSTPIPSPLLEPGMLASVSGPTACAIGASPMQASSSGMRNPAAAGLMNFCWVSNVAIVFEVIFFINVNSGDLIFEFSVSELGRHGRVFADFPFFWAIAKLGNEFFAECHGFPLKRGTKIRS